MNQYWIAVIGTSAIAFALKYSGHSVPEKWLSHPRIQRINALIPIALLSALVAAQTFTEKSKLMIDHRLLGLAVAIVALLLKAPFPVVVLSAAVSSALLYNFGN
jgi:branched-subunit amino acid transport protein